MKVTCDTKGILIMNKGNQLANASITLDDAFVIRNLRVMNGSNGLFVSMPSQKGLDKDGKEKYYDSAFPLNKELRGEINKVVLDAYSEKLNELSQEAQNRAAPHEDSAEQSEADNAEQDEADNECYPF